VPQLRKCLRDPIPEIYDAARYLDAAASAHLAGEYDMAARLITLADIPDIRDWTESLWGSKSPYNSAKTIANASPGLPKEERVKVRMPNSAEKNALQERDGFHCRFCGIPVIRREIRDILKKAYPHALSWGSKNIEQHAAFQALWLQYDHVLPHARGGNNELGNIVITCAPCNYGRNNNLCEEVGVQDPFQSPPISSTWDGLERVLYLP
jgi:HNH endonuclease